MHSISLPLIQSLFSSNDCAIPPTSIWIILAPILAIAPTICPIANANLLAKLTSAAATSSLKKIYFKDSPIDFNDSQISFNFLASNDKSNPCLNRPANSLAFSISLLNQSTNPPSLFCNTSNTPSDSPSSANPESNAEVSIPPAGISPEPLPESSENDNVLSSSTFMFV